MIGTNYLCVGYFLCRLTYCSGLAFHKAEDMEFIPILESIPLVQRTATSPHVDEGDRLTIRVLQRPGKENHRPAQFTSDTTDTTTADEKTE